jgi:hypothetical protein
MLVKRERCWSCEVTYINGIRCHEHGCPEAWRDEQRECRECGTGFIPETSDQSFCSDICNGAYNGFPLHRGADDDGEEDEGMVTAEAPAEPNPDTVYCTLCRLFKPKDYFYASHVRTLQYDTASGKKGETVGHCKKCLKSSPANRASQLRRSARLKAARQERRNEKKRLQRLEQNKQLTPEPKESGNAN